MTVIKFSLFASQRKCSKMACNYWFGVLLLGQCLLVCSSVALHGNNIDNAERESDGAYRPRDAEHYSDAGHNVEFDHEAILGSVKEAEEFDKLSPEESKQRLAEMLPRMDLNGDGMIDRQELKKWILNSFINLSKEEADERLQEADEDKDGVVSWQEYLRDTFGTDIEAEVADDESSDSGLLISEEKAMWKAADVNLDGSLDSREFEVFNNPEEHAVMHPYLINQTLREKDRNNDGKIDFQEFIGDRGSQQDRAWLVAEREKFDHELDLDKDGSLDASEVKQWVIPNNDEIADEEVDHLFASADDDHDDLLSFLEVVSHHDVFVGSEAADGDILGDHFSDEL